MIGPFLNNKVGSLILLPLEVERMPTVSYINHKMGATRWGYMPHFHPELTPDFQNGASNCQLAHRDSLFLHSSCTIRGEKGFWAAALQDFKVSYYSFHLIATWAGMESIQNFHHDNVGIFLLS